jgi:hypothetical protein
MHARHGPPQKTHQMLSIGYPLLLSGVSEHALLSKGHPTGAYSLLRDVFTGLLLSNGCPIGGWPMIGACLHICFLQTDQSVTILSRFICDYRGDTGL